MVRYQYILEGYDKEWGPVTEKTSAFFGNISEGSYTFKLKARSPEGAWSEPIDIILKCCRPGGEHGGSEQLMGIFFFSLLYGIYRWRTAALRKQKRILGTNGKSKNSRSVEEKAE